MPEPDDPFAGDVWRAYADQVRADLIPKLRDSAVTLSLFPGGDLEDLDIKFMMETGAAICLGLPIVLVIRPGTIVPAGLARAAEEIVELDLDAPDVATAPAAGDAINAAIRRVIG